LIVDFYEASVVGLDSHGLKVKPFSVGRPSNSDQQVRGFQSLLALRCPRRKPDEAIGANRARNIRAQQQVYAVLAQDSRYFIRDIGVFARKQSIAPMDDRHLASVPSKHLSELESN